MRSACETLPCIVLDAWTPACRGSSLRSWLAICPLSSFIRRLSSQVPQRKLALWTFERADFVERQFLVEEKCDKHALSSARLNQPVFRRRNETPVDAGRGGERPYTISPKIVELMSVSGIFDLLAIVSYPER